nr:carotenoid oxygenase family protein [Nocardia transvalensis]
MVSQPVRSHPAFGHKAELAFDADGNQLQQYAANNTDVKVHAGRILSLSEQTIPYEMSPELDTIGPYTFGGKLRGNFIAHPKLDPATGALHSFGYDMVRPIIDYYVIDAAGELTTDVRFEIEAPTFLHDMALTEHYVLVFQTPATYDMSLLDRNPCPIVWTTSSRFRSVQNYGRGSWWDERVADAISRLNSAHTSRQREDAREGARVIDYFRLRVGAGWGRGRRCLRCPQDNGSQDPLGDVGGRLIGQAQRLGYVPGVDDCVPDLLLVEGRDVDLSPEPLHSTESAHVCHGGERVLHETGSPSIAHLESGTAVVIVHGGIERGPVHRADPLPAWDRLAGNGCGDADVLVDEVEVQITHVPRGARHRTPEVALCDLGQERRQVFGQGVQHGYIHCVSSLPLSLVSTSPSGRLSRFRGPFRGRGH